MWPRLERARALSTLLRRLAAPPLACGLASLVLVACGGEAPASESPDLAEADAPTEVMAQDVDIMAETGPDAGLDTTPDNDLGPADTVPTDTTDADLVVPDTVSPPLPIEAAIVDQLAPGSWRWVIIVDAATLLASDGDRLLWLSGTSASPVAGLGRDDDLPMPSLYVPPPAVVTGPGDVLVGTPDGLLRVKDGQVAPSPLAERFREPIFAMVAEGPDAPSPLWLSTASGLFRWSADAVVPYSVTGISLAGNLLAFGPPFYPEAATTGPTPDPPPALWLAGQHGTSALRPAPSAFGLERPQLTAPPVVALGADREGHLYALSADAEPALHVRAPDDGKGRWVRAPLEAPRDLAAHPGSPSIWVSLADGRLVRGSGTDFAEVSPLPAAIGASRHLAQHADGRLVVATATGLFEVAASRSLTVSGLPLTPSTPLVTTTLVTVRASDPGAVASASAVVSTVSAPAPLPVLVTGAGAERSITVTIDPLLIPNSAPDTPHLLTVSVTWDDEETVTISSPFSVDFPTWAGSVKPFFDRSCANCHGANNGGNFASLHTAASWQTRMDEILCRIDAHAPEGPTGTAAPECATLGFDVASMPPGRVISAPNVQMLRTWRDAGFRP